MLQVLLLFLTLGTFTFFYVADSNPESLKCFGQAGKSEQRE